MIARPLDYSPRSHPVAFVPTTYVFDSPGIQVCINEQYIPFILGALEVLAQGEYWPDDHQVILLAIDDLFKVLCGPSVDCSVLPELWSCRQDLASSDHGWTIISSFGTYGTGDGWGTVSVSGPAYTFYGGPDFAVTTTLTRVEIDIDWDTLGGGDVVGIWTDAPGPVSLATQQNGVSGLHTYVFGGLNASVDNLRLNPNGQDSGHAQIVGLRMFGAGGNPVGDCD